MSRPTACAAVAILLLSASAVFADGTAPAPAATAPAPAPALSLESCVAQALAKNFSVRIQSFTTEQARDAVIIAQAGYDPTVTLNAQKSVSQAAPTTSLGSGDTYGQYANDQTATLSVAQKIITGGTVTVSSDLDRSKSVPAGTLPNPAYASDLGLSVSQPLLQNAGTDYNRAAIERAKLGVQIANLNFKSTVLTVVFNVETAYFNLIFARENYKVQQDNLHLAQELCDENTVKRQTGVVTDLDVLQSQVGVADARNQLILARQAVHNGEDSLLQAIGRRDFEPAVGPVDFPPAPVEADVSFARSYKLARDNGPDLALVDAAIAQLKLDALTTRRNTLPELDLNGGVGYNNTGSSYSDAVNHVWNNNGYNWQAGVTLTFPWGQRANRALYRQAIASLRSEQTQYDQTDEALVVQVRAAVRAVETNLESVRASAEAADLSEKQYELQKAKFDAGLATSYDVLQAQTELETARVSALQAKVSLRVAGADLRFLEGSSLPLYRISLAP